MVSIHTVGNIWLMIFLSCVSMYERMLLVTKDVLRIEVVQFLLAYSRMDDKDTVFCNWKHLMFSHFLNIGTILAMYWSSCISPLTSDIWSSLTRYWYRTPATVLKLNWTNKYILFFCQSSKREIVGSSSAAGKNFSCCNFPFLRMAHSSNQPIQMKSTVTFT